ncbi:hypothetical protein AB0I22_09760 [Streptomyces sp. NPDC050610]|uniref:hypothetical protein n=1 Tax=Streptomyces sp. NPDC050610 TaxID=3157097 RepID=UPI003412FCCE
MISERSRTAHSESAGHLAGRALDVLRGVEGTAVAAHVEEAGDPAVALGAVRMLGADVLAPYALTGLALPPGEAEAVRLALDALPPVQPPPAAPPAGEEQPWLMAWADWGLLTLLSAAEPADVTGSPPLQPPYPQGPPQYDGSAPRHLPPTAAAGPDGDGAVREGWAPWSVRMGRLASLALPGLDGPVHDAARQGAVGLARGAGRATLRRDFATAARIARWLAWLHAEGVALPLDPAPLTTYIQLAGGDGGRLALDTAIARRLLGLEPV